MRTTVTLDPDVEKLLRRAQRERGHSFKAVLNAALREGLSRSHPRAGKRFRQKTFSMGVSAPGVNLIKSLALAARLEEEEAVRKLELGK